jgi:DNA polymerase-3 subunit beta
MKVNTREFLQELEWTTRFIATKSTIPILCNVLLDAGKRKLSLTGTDLEMGGITEIPGEESKPWKLTVPAKYLLKYLKKVAEPEVNLAAGKNNWLTVTHGDEAIARFGGRSMESFPELPKIKTTARLSGLTAAIPRIIFAISSEESRFSLNGALLDVDKDGARMVSADKHRISYCEVGYEGEHTRALIPRVCLAQLAALKVDDIACGAEDKHLMFASGVRGIICRKLEGNFPDYWRVLPREYPHHVQVEATPLLKVLDRVRVFTDEPSHAVKLTVGDGKLTVTAYVSETGEGSGHVPILGGEEMKPITIGANCDYMMDVLRQLDGETVAFCYDKPVNAFGLVTADGWQNSIMPMRT